MTSYLPIRPESQTHVLKLYTFRDAVEHVLLAFDVDSASKHFRYARAAVLEAYRAFPDEHRWNWLERTAGISTVESQNTGSISYTASTRTVTLTGANWPDSARFMSILINSQVCKVQSRSSNSVIVLDPNQCPAEDIAAGASYAIFRSVYPLPADFRKGSQLVSLTEASVPAFRAPQDLLEALSFNYSPTSIQDFYTIRSSSDYMGGMCIEFSPPPSTRRVFNFRYTASPRPLQMFGTSTEYSAGTINSPGSTAVAGTGTSFDSSMIGCVIRINASSGNTNTPTGMFGYDSADNPYAEQRVVTEVSGATSLTIDSPFTGTYSSGNFKYSIGAPIDFEPESMMTAFLMLCESSFSRMIRQKESAEKLSRYLLELRRAIAADNRQRDPGFMPGPTYTSLGDLNRGNN